MSRPAFDCFITDTCGRVPREPRPDNLMIIHFHGSPSEGQIAAYSDSQIEEFSFVVDEFSAAQSVLRTEPETTYLGGWLGANGRNLASRNIVSRRSSTTLEFWCTTHSRISSSTVSPVYTKVDPSDTSEVARQYRKSVLHERNETLFRG